MADVLFSILEKWQEGRQWGSFLDAGTGLNNSFLSFLFSSLLSSLSNIK